MERIETNLMDGWQFAFNEHEEKNYRSIVLPHDWAVNRPFNKDMDQCGSQGFRDRWGVGWYRKKLCFPVLKKGKVYQLRFDGVYENCTVWVNDRLVGKHAYGYSAFVLDITDFLKEGDNDLLVKVDNTVRPADRWYSGAGIYRPVTLLELPEDHLCPEDIHVTYCIDGDDTLLTVETGKNELVCAKLFDEELECCGQSQSGKIRMKVQKVKLWSAAAPNLYHLEVSLGPNGAAVDKISLKVGFRKIQMDSSKGMLVNGKTVKLKGVCLHQDAGCFGTAVPREIWKEKLLSLKEIGCNAIRAAHHTHA